MDKSELAKALGSLGGKALADRWRDLQEKAEAGEPEAVRELARRRRAMKRRGKLGGRPRKNAP